MNKFILSLIQRIFSDDGYEIESKNDLQANVPRKATAQYRSAKEAYRLQFITAVRVTRLGYVQ